MLLLIVVAKVSLPIPISNNMISMKSSLLVVGNRGLPSFSFVILPIFVSNNMENVATMKSACYEVGK